MSARAWGNLAGHDGRATYSNFSFVLPCLVGAEGTATQNFPRHLDANHQPPLVVGIEVTRELHPANRPVGGATIHEFRNEVIAMPWGIVIPADEEAPLEYRLFATLQDYQETVGGLIEAIDPDNPAGTFYANEEGKLRNLPLNRRATLLWWGVSPAARNADALMGNVVLIGPPDDDGDTTDVLPAYVKMLFPESPFRIEVETLDSPGVWNGNQAEYATCFEAWNAAFSLMQRWMAVTDVRVVPV